MLMPPHFHAEYQDFEVTMVIVNGLVTGKMPRRALNLIRAWVDEHPDELTHNWELASARRPLEPIDPLR